MRWVRIYFWIFEASTNNRTSILRQARVSRVARWYTRKWCFSKNVSKLATCTMEVRGLGQSL
jgi:hypothetical protein